MLEQPPIPNPTQRTPLRRSMDLTVWEGVAFIMGNSLTAGVFVASFATALGADARAMGVLGAMPSAAQLMQLAGAHLVAHVGKRKVVFLGANALCAAVWAVVAAAAFFLLPMPGQVWAFVAFYALTSVCVSTRGLAWLDWMRDMVPRALRGRFFAHRNRQALLAGMLLSVPAAHLIDRYRAAHAGGGLEIFGAVFGIAAALMAAAVFIGRRIDEPAMTPPDKDGLWKTAVRNAWSSKSFRHYFFFRLYICLAMSTTGPLLTFYLLRDLRCSTTLVNGLEVMATLIGAATLLLWGKFADRVGNRPAMMLTFLIKVIWSGLWVFLTPEPGLPLLILIYVLSAHGPGNVLLHQSMLLKLVPDKGAAASLSMFNAITQGAATLSPILAGIAVQSILPAQTTWLGVTLTNWQQLILISTVLRVGGVVGLIWVHEPASMGLRAFVRSLRRGFTPEETFSAGLPLESDEEERKS